MHDILKRASQIGIIPVIAIEDANKAVPLAKALIEGGLPAAEVTFRTAAGEEAIRQIAENCPEILLGAGTVLNIEQCDRAIAAGAKFIVSPGYNEELVRHCIEIGITVLPGCVNASDITKAVNAGLKTVKFFPAEQSGGVAGIKALAPVFPAVSFMPTGGVNTKNMMDYLLYNRILACGGTWMVKKELIEGERWEEITAICKDAVKTMLGFELMHIGINCTDEEEAAKSAKLFCSIFGLKAKDSKNSVFAGTAVEYMKAPGFGKYGHIAVGTNSMERATAYLSGIGVEFCDASKKMDEKGVLRTVYLKEEIAGFAIQLIQK